MKPLLYLANIFINTFGITQPTPKTANRAAWFIAFMLLGVIVTVTAVAILTFIGLLVTNAPLRGKMLVYNSCTGV